MAETDLDRIATLSPREREVMVLLSKGMSLTETARLLCLSRNTINDYAKVIHRKLDVTRRVEVAVIAAKAGLV